MAESLLRTKLEKLPSNQGGPPAGSSHTSTQLRDGCLCLDSGTRASRLAFARLKQSRRTAQSVHFVQRDGSDNGIQAFEDSDFPAGMQPFALHKRPKDCIGFISDEPDQFPVKIYPYILRALKLRERGYSEDLAAIEEFAETIPQLGTFLSAFDSQKSEDIKAKVVDHGLAIYISHLQQLKAIAEEQARFENIRITTLGATFPSNWDNWTQKWFIEILNNVWGDSIKPDSIELIQESHAAAHWLMYLTSGMRRTRPTQIVLADFGGHTFSVEAFHIIYHDETGDRFSVAAIWDPDCVHAGSELHAAYVRDFVQDQLTRQAKAKSLPADQALLFKKLMQNYHSQKLDLRRGEALGLSCTIQSPDTKGAILTFAVEISVTVADRFYDLCFGKAFKALKRTLNSKAIKKGTTVVFTGGSFYNKHVREEAEMICADAGMICPPWTQKSKIQNSRNARLVSGAVMCLVNATSVSDFMARAAFALRINHLQVVTPHLVWNQRGYRVTKQFQGGQGGDILVVCSPKGLGRTMPTGAPEYALETSFFEHAYDFRMVGKAKQGTYIFSMVYNEATEQESDNIVLSVEHPGSDEPQRVFKWSIFLDKGAGLCLSELEPEKRSSGRGRRSSRWRRAHGKGTATRAEWEQDHKDGSLRFWRADLEPLADVTSREIRQALERARLAAPAARVKAESPPTTITGTTSFTAPMPQSPRTRPQRQTMASLQTEAGPSTVLATHPEAIAGRKRRGTSSAHRTTTTRQKAINTDPGAETVNSSFTFSTLDIGANSSDDESQMNPYAAPGRLHKTSITRTSSNNDQIERGNNAQEAEWSLSTQSPRAEPSRYNHACPADDVSTVQSRTRSGSSIQEMTVSQRRNMARSQYRIPTTQTIVSEDFEFEIDRHWASLQQDTKRTK